MYWLLVVIVVDGLANGKLPLIGKILSLPITRCQFTPRYVMRYPTLDFTPQSEIFIHSHIQQPGKNQRYVLPIYIVKKISGEKEKRKMFQEI